MNPVTVGDFATIDLMAMESILAIETTLLSKAMGCSLEDVQKLNLIELGDKIDELRSDLIAEPEVIEENNTYKVILLHPVGDVKEVAFKQGTLKDILDNNNDIAPKLTILMEILSDQSEEVIMNMSLADAFAGMQRVIPKVMFPPIFLWLNSEIMRLRLNLVAGM